MNSRVIVLQEEGILITEGRKGRQAEILEAKRIPIDGFAEPLEQWKEALKSYLKNKESAPVKLVLPATESFSKVVQIPYAKGKELNRMAEHVMQENRTEGVMDYGVLQADKEQGICLCCGGAGEGLLKGLSTLEEECQFTIEEITVPMECYLNLLFQTQALKEQTAVVLFFEESSVTSILMREGRYLYSTRSRIFSERGTFDFGTEIVRNVSGILQFYATTKSEIPLENVYYAGCAADDFVVSENGLRGLKLEVAPLNTIHPFEFEESAENLAVCIGAFLTGKKKSVNLKKVWDGQKKSVKRVENKAFWKHFLFPAATLFLCLLGLLAVFLWNRSVSGEIEELNRWIQDPKVIAEYEEAKALEEESERLSNGQEQVDTLKENLATYPDLSESMIRKIVDVGGRDMRVRIRSMEAQSGLLTFDAVSEKVIDIPDYVEKLGNTGLFSSVQYVGYNYQENEYVLALSCILKGIGQGGNES